MKNFKGRLTSPSKYNALQHQERARIIKINIDVHGQEGENSPGLKQFLSEKLIITLLHSTCK